MTILDLAHFLPLPHVLWDQVAHEGFVGMKVSHVRIVKMTYSEDAYKVSVAYCIQILRCRLVLVITGEIILFNIFSQFLFYLSKLNFHS